MISQIQTMLHLPSPKVIFGMLCLWLMIGTLVNGFSIPNPMINIVDIWWSLNKHNQEPHHRSVCHVFIDHIEQFVSCVLSQRWWFCETYSEKAWWIAYCIVQMLLWQCLMGWLINSINISLVLGGEITKGICRDHVSPPQTIVNQD